jgi:hypothetical protein
MKRGPISNSDKEYLLKNQNKPLKLLAKKIQRSEESIQTFFDSLKKEEEIATEKVEQIKRKDTPINNALVRNKKYGAVIMTPTASMIADDKKKIRKNNKFGSKVQGFIHIMNPEE